MTIPLFATKRADTYRLRQHRSGVIATTRYRRGNPVQEFPPQATRPLPLLLITAAMTAMRRPRVGKHTA